MALATPLQSVRILPLPTTLPWGQARIPGSALTTVNVTAAVDSTAYAARDFELTYRDIILMALLSELSVQAAEIFGLDTTRLAVQGVPAGDLQASGVDMATVAFPGAVAHVKPSSRPIAAIATDRQLYARDVLLYESLVRVGSIFEVAPFNSVVGGVTPTDVWSLAEGQTKRASVSGSLPLSVRMFKEPDQLLADRDNKVATAIANVAYELNDLYGRATRLFTQVSDVDGPRESEIYVFKSDDGRYRRFVATPGLEDRNQIVYDRTLRTVTWFGESFDGSGSTAFAGALALTFASTSLTVRGALPTYEDAQFWRQKSNRLKVNTYRAVPLYYQPNPVADVSLASGAVYQPDGVYLPAPGSGVAFNPQISNPSTAHYRLAIYFEPSRIARVFGSLNLNGVAADGAETATLTGTGLLNWQIKLIEGRYTVRFKFADNSASTDNFQVRVVWNGVVLFEGFILYGKDAGTFIFSNSYVLAADGDVGSFTIERTDTGPGHLTIGVVEIVNVREGNLSCKMTATMGSVSSTAIFSSQSGRPDTLFFDFFNANPGTISLFLDDVNIGGLYLRVIDVRRFGSQRETSQIAGYRLWKRTYMNLALESVRRAYKLSAPTAPTFSNSTVWNQESTDAWMNFLLVVEPRLFGAFRVGRPGDIGQPALTPSGLYYDIGNREARQLDPSDSFPTKQTFQPWMISAGIYVFHEEFWIDDFDPTTSLSGAVNDCDFLTADFTAQADV
jgi:hypothetical protein